MDPRGAIRQTMARGRTVVNPNPGLSGNSERVEGNFFHFFDIDQAFNGEDFTAGSLLIGNNSPDEPNWIFRSDTGEMQYRIGTTVIFNQYGGGVRVNREFALSEIQVSVTNGNIDLDRQGYSCVRIVSATGNFTIQSISDAGDTGVEFELINDTTFNMSLENNAGGTPVGYSDVFLLDATLFPIATKTGYSFACLKYEENISALGSFQWMLKSWNG